MSPPPRLVRAVATAGAKDTERWDTRGCVTCPDFSSLDGLGGNRADIPEHEW